MEAGPIEGLAIHPVSGKRAPMLHSVDHYRRLQVGGIGLAAVILLVGLASILADQKDGTSAFSFDRDIADMVSKDKGPSEPLSELGVQPAPPSETKVPQMRPTLPRPANGNANGSSNTLPPSVRPGERVQDLPPSSTTPRAQ